MFNSKSIILGFAFSFLCFTPNQESSFLNEVSYSYEKEIESFKRKLAFQRFKSETNILMAPNECYSVSDGTNALYTIDKYYGSPVNYIGPTGVSNIEAMTTSPDGSIIYGFDDATWGTIDPATGNFTAIGDVGTGDGSTGPVTFNNVDGVAIDARTLQYFGSERQSDGAPEDLLFEFDPTTGEIIEDAFGPGVDYVVIQTASIPVSPTLYDIDDMGVNALTGGIYGVSNSSGANDRLVKIDRTDGSVTDIGRITHLGVPLHDIESLSFSNNGTAFITSASSNYFYSIDVTDATTTQLGSFPSGSDFEGIACLTDGANDIAGTVFFDFDYSGTYNAGDAPSPGELVYFYEDINDDGVVDPGDDLLQTQFSDASGDYYFEVAIEGNFLVAIDNSGVTMTTPDEIEVDFVGVGNTSVDNDFGYVCKRPVAVTDYETTVIDVPVAVDVLFNDSACNGLDPSTVTNTGVLSPTNGTITFIDPVTGFITYLPNSGYSGLDSFEYIICDLAPVSLCDTAMVYIDIQCIGIPGQNDIAGSVFEDINMNQVYDVSESGQLGVTVYLYEDNSPNDSIPDGPPVQTTVSSASGTYGFTVHHSYSLTYANSYTLGSDSDDARERSSGTTQDDRSNHRITGSGNDKWNGFRFTNLTIPAGAIINTATITYTAYRSDSNTPASTRFYGQDNTSNPSTFLDCSSCYNITGRTKTSASVDWTNISGWVQNNTYTTPNLNSIVQEIVSDQAGLTNEPIVFITEGISPGYERRRVYSRDTDSSKAPVLNINYTVPGGGPYNYVVKIDEATLPLTAMMTTDNLEIVSFNSDGTTDCKNDFGFSLPCQIFFTNRFIMYKSVD